MSHYCLAPPTRSFSSSVSFVLILSQPLLILPLPRQPLSQHGPAVLATIHKMLLPPGTGTGTSTSSASLGGLPPELVLRIIPDVLPGGFDSHALSSRALYALCEPYHAS